MSVEAVIQLLTSDAQVRALVGSQITPEWREQTDPLPGITVTNVTTTRSRDLLAPVSLSEGLVQVDVYAAGYVEAYAVAAAVREALDDYGGTVNGIEVDRIGLDQYQDLGQIDGDRSVRRVSLDFNVWFQE